jgi:hypothetical protein
LSHFTNPGPFLQGNKGRIHLSSSALHWSKFALVMFLDKRTRSYLSALHFIGFHLLWHIEEFIKSVGLAYSECLLTQNAHPPFLSTIPKVPRTLKFTPQIAPRILLRLPCTIFPSLSFCNRPRLVSTLPHLKISQEALGEV